MKIFTAALLLLLVSLSGAPASAWGEKGHTLISAVAAAQFTGRMPAFVSDGAGQFEIAYLGPQLDRLKGSGEAWDGENDPGHYLDLLDDGSIAGVVSLAQLPPTREAYDTALRAAHTDQYRQGYLPYAILEGWEQLRSDFASFRVDDYVASHAASAGVRAHYAAIRNVDEQITLADLGTWGHYVGDASQPLHATVHFNGWGEYPNPNGYTQSPRTHSFFESTFVNRYMTADAVRSAVRAPSSLAVPYSLLTQEQVLADIAAYLQQTLSTVPHLYDLEKSGAFASGSPDAREFTAARLAAGAMELRDLSVLAWQDSKYARVGYPAARVQDILDGKAAYPRP